MKRTIVACLLLSLGALGACAVDSTSSGDAYATDSCATATVDAYGYCRAVDGRFARSECCAPAGQCEMATLDDHGICRRVDNGRFAPVACCEALCGGASLDAHGYCRAQNGRFALSACCGNECVGQQGGDSPACPTTVNSADIAQAVDELRELFFDGRSSDANVASSAPLEMVKEYIQDRYYDDPDILDEYEFVENAAEFVADEPIAGTIQLQPVIDEAVGQLEWLYEWNLEPEEIAPLQDRATRAIQAMVAAGAALGFDGFDQNYCAAPTYMLLVLDPATQRVEGVDLSPCTE